SKMGRAFGHDDAGAAHRLDLRFRVALAARDNGARVAHAAALGRGAPGDEAGDRLPAALLLLGGKEFRRLFLGGTADLADHDDRPGLGVFGEPVRHVDVLGALDRVAADADGRGLAEAEVRGLLHRLVGQRAGARDDADRALLVDMPRHDADLAFAGRDDAGAVRADEPRFRAFQRALDLHHVQNRNPFRDADDERHLGVDRLEDRIRREGGRNVDRGGVRAGPGHRLVDRVEAREAEVFAPALAGRHAADHLRAVGDGLFGVEGALAAGDALADDAGVFFDEDG